MGFDHGRFSDRDSADPDRLHRRPAVLRSRHRDYRHEIVEDPRAPRRPTFDEVAELYDRVRPGYPAELFDDLVELAGLNAGSRVLEIGCGTGQATLPLAKRNLAITALELGSHLAAVARRNLMRFPNVTVVVGVFEDWPAPREPFDAVVSATAFHWLDPSVRVTKAAEALRLGGVLATIATHHVDGGDAQFFTDVQECYRRWFPENAGFHLPAAAEVKPDTGELEQSGLFAAATFRRYEWDQPYSAQEYIDLLSTYSDHRALEDARRQDLLACVRRLINERYGGRIRKRYLNELRIARRRGAPPA